MKEQHKQVDRCIKREARRNRRSGFKEFVSNLATSPAGQALATMGRMLRSRMRNRKNNGAAVQRIRPAESFSIDQSWEAAIEDTIIRAPKGKAVGSDEIFAELLKVDTARSAKLVSAIWRCCGRLRVFSTECSPPNGSALSCARC